ncbi:MAG: ABC transporter ATP-binding protein [Spirochaetales bacterium]|nr:ABC transporter ATP-binding protein [Spirochaetales bacterium]
MSASRQLVDKNLPMMNRRGSNRFREVQHAKDAKGTLKRIWAYFAREKRLICALVCIVIVGTVCGVAAPSIQARGVDIIAGGEGDLMRTVVLMLSLYLSYTLCQFIQTLISGHLSQRIVKHLRSDLFSKIVDLPISYLDRHSHGDVMSRMTNDIENISTTVSQALPSLASGALIIAGTTIIMFVLCYQLAILSFISIFLTIKVTRFLSGKVRKFSRSRQSLLGRLNGNVEEMVWGYRTVVSFNQQKERTRTFAETSDSLTRAGIRQDCFSGVMGPVMNCISNLSFVIIAVFGGYFASRGMITLGVISAFIVYSRQFARPINEISQVYGQLQTAIAGAERVFELLDVESEDMEGEALKEEKQAAVSFRGVDFSYVKNRSVLKNFSLEVPAGKRVALVGATGSGKTTVVNLLMRFYDIDSGAIEINGQDISKIRRADIRRDVAIVLQDTFLFSSTIRENLRYSHEGATDEEIERAMRMSRVDGMVKSLPLGLDTVLEASGSNISQGQRQLVAIARAFAQDPRILILDEATSNVDTRTEKEIQKAIEHVLKNRTSIIIAHRLSTIRDADMIVVLDGGTIVERGRHEELIAERGRYYELYMTQFRGFAT